jgi:peptidoglycan L-alanyl-D-glutamate endopeptidase CwlK
MAAFSKRSEDNLKGVHPKLVEVLRAAIEDAPQDFTIVSGVRTEEEQVALYAQGRTAPGLKVTQSDGVRKRSNHQTKKDGFGYAVDVYPFDNGSVQVNAPREDFEKIARHIQDHAERQTVLIDWGGDWRTFKDLPHLELVSYAVD